MYTDVDKLGEVRYSMSVMKRFNLKKIPLRLVFPQLCDDCKILVMTRPKEFEGCDECQAKVKKEIYGALPL